MLWYNFSLIDRDKSDMEYILVTLFEVIDNVSFNSTNPTDKYTFNYPLN